MTTRDDDGPRRYAGGRESAETDRRHGGPGRAAATGRFGYDPRYDTSARRRQQDVRQFGPERGYGSPGGSGTPGERPVSGTYGEMEAYGSGRGSSDPTPGVQRDWSGSRGQGGYGGPEERAYGEIQPERHGQTAGLGSSAGSGPRGPKGYRRSDDRLREEICERIAQSERIDAGDVTVGVQDASVTLEGTIADRAMKYELEELVDRVTGVREVDNRVRIRVRRSGPRRARPAPRWRARPRSRRSMRCPAPGGSPRSRTRRRPSRRSAAAASAGRERPSMPSACS
jgi:hypothetical protein